MFKRLKGSSSVNMASTVCAIAAALLSLVLVPVAQGSTLGELEHVGKFGEGAGQFTYPSGIAVDSSDNSVYVLDEPGGEERGAGPLKFRIQKFNVGLGAPTGSIDVATPMTSGHKQVIDGIAVDSALHRLYVLKGVEVERSLSSAPYVAEEIEAYSTETLQLASDVKTGANAGVLYEFPVVPNTGALPGGTVLQPTGVAVDPKNHDLLVLGRDEEEDTVIQQIAVTTPTYASGASGEAFDDTGNRLGRSKSAADGIAVAPDGSVYATVKLLAAPEGQGVAKLTIEEGHTLASPLVNEVQHSSNAGGAGSLTGGTEGNGRRDAGAQVAVSPDSGLVYAMQVTTPQLSGLGEDAEGDYEVRGMSTASSELGSTKVVLGGGVGGSSPKCHIASAASAIAAGNGGVVYVLDEGDLGFNEVEEILEPTSFGYRVVEFGPNGSGCPIPVAAFTINGKPSETAVTINKGQTATFDAAGSQLNGEEPVEAQWDLDDSGKYEKVVTGSPASLETSMKYLKPGHYTIGLKIILKGNGTFGNPAPVTGTLIVEPVAPVASFEIFPSANGGEALRIGQTIKSGESVRFDGHGSSDPVGGPNGEPTNKLESYTWEFGDGEVVKKPESEAEFTRTFSNGGSEPRQETVTLTVENKDGTNSAAVTESLTIAGTESVKQPPKEPVKEPIKEVLPIKEPTKEAPPVSTPPVKKPLTRAQKLAKALKLCKKDKPKRKRLVCEKAARKKYGPKKKMKTKK